ncbi:hypothetical protein [Chitinimonas koreensis]|uniref:hypothetical protein n=1 Tax=Chitinimonas koreensis TaxID=356302 RepID=UPI000422A7FA|nr:hypothetical protein [Chitinimonas koreensis]QNM98655.1 hypothetical protein H9L41_10790 [Chitinimonas koreensis]
MPTQIGKVDSEIQVDGGGDAPGAAGSKPLPGKDELFRWQQLARQHEWDESRTRALDFDD